MKGIIVTTVETEPGRVQISMYERHAVGEVGDVMRHELTEHEMQHMHEVLTRALWDRVRKAL